MSYEKDRGLSKEEIEVLNKLPTQLKNQMVEVVRMRLFSQIDFLQYTTEPSFVAWFITQLKPVYFDKDEIVFKKGERVVEVLFMCSGKAVTETGVISGGTNSIIGFKKPTEIFYPGCVLGLYRNNNASAVTWATHYHPS